MSRMSPDISDRLTGLFSAGETVLDVGCGSCELLRAYAGKGLRLYGVDPDFSATLPPVPDDIQLAAGTAEQLPFPDGSFDAVILQCVFSLCRAEEAVREVSRVMKPGGRLILSDLFSDLAEIRADESPLVGAVYLRKTLEHFFVTQFDLVSFTDLTPALTEMIIEAIWCGEEAACASCGDLSLLRNVKARYGLWIWRKPLSHPSSTS